MPTVTFYIAKKAVPVNMTVAPKEILLEFTKFKPLIEQVKVMEGAEWLPDLKMWSVKYSGGNLFRIAVLMRSKRIDRYYAPLVLTNPKYNTQFSIEFPLWKHQLEMYSLLLQKRRQLFGAQPRTGKTRPSVQAFLDSEFSFAWFVTTKPAALGLNRELSKWFNSELATYTDESIGIKPVRIADKRIYPMTYDKLCIIYNKILSGEVSTDVIPPFLILDVCHKLKTPSSARSKAAAFISEMMEKLYGDNSYVVGLSGTPAPLDVTDWWSQCETIRSGIIREGSLTKFKVRYGEYKPWLVDCPAWERFQGWNKEEIALLSKRLEPLVRVYFQKDCMELPPIEYERVQLTPSKSLLRVAKMITETSKNALETRRRLRQIADGFEYTNEYDEETNKMVRTGSAFVGSPKIDQLKEDLDTYEVNGRVIIYAGFQGSVDICTKTCREAGWSVLQIDGRGHFFFAPDGEAVSDPKVIQLALAELDRSTDSGSIPKLAFVAETDAGGTGLELSSSPVIIYYSNSDSGEGRMQSERRAYSNNMDKDRGLLIKDYLLLPTDELILNKLKDKEALQNLSMGEMIELYKNI